MKANPPRKHHFVPEFYLKQWCGPDGKVVEHRLIGNKMVSKVVGPSATGFEKDLYSFPDLAPQDAQIIESKFLQYADQIVCLALKNHLDQEPAPWTEELRSGWSRFLMGMHFRHPDTIAELRAAIPKIWKRTGADAQKEYEKFRQPDHPEKFDDFLEQNDPQIRSKVAVRMLMTVLDHERIGARYNGMIWNTIDVSDGPREFFTSDRPLEIVDIGGRDGFLSLPISPTKLFVAANSNDIIERAKNEPLKKLVSNINAFVVSRARRYAYSRSLHAKAFISKRIGTNLESVPFFPTVSAD